jgi:hypothetical protein
MNMLFPPSTWKILFYTGDGGASYFSDALVPIFQNKQCHIAADA